jgi:hypothetical protein
MGWKPKDWTEEDSVKREKALQQWWNNEGYPGKPPEALRKWYMEDVSRTPGAGLTYLRTKKKDIWRQTVIYRNRREDARKALLDTFGDIPEFITKDFLDEHADRIAFLNPNRKFGEIITTLLQKKLIGSRVFTENHPSMDAWLRANGYVGIKEVTGDSLKLYLAARKGLIEAWKSWNSGNGFKPPTDEMLNRALAENWSPTQWEAEFTKSADYGSTGAYKDKAADFEEFWENNMRGVNFDEGVFERAMDAYARSSSSRVDDWMTRYGVDYEWWDQAFPEWDDWFAAYDEDSKAGFDDYLKERRAYIDRWDQLFGDNSEIDPALLSKALRERWDLNFFEKQVKSLPAYGNTPDAKEKGMRFDDYWHSIMGEGAPVDESLRQKYISSGSSDTSLMWDDIKETSLFRAQFPNWEAFATSQYAAGVNVTKDPARYNAYRKAMQDAFAETGTFMPAGLEAEIFGSGLSESDIETGVGTWAAGKDSLAIVGGQQADLRTSMGLNDKVVGGQLRDRLRQAIDAHAKYLNSTTAQYKVRETGEAELVTQKI